MAQICAQFGISRQAHYQKLWREETKPSENEMMLEMVRQVRRKHPRMGTRKLLFKISLMLVAERLQIGRDRLFELLREPRFAGRPPKNLPADHHSRPVASSQPPAGTDHLPSQPGLGLGYHLPGIGDRPLCLLFVLMDLYAAISWVGMWLLPWLRRCPDQPGDGPVPSAPMPQDLIHHSDHGVQYTSHAYMNTLLAHHIQPSMGAVGNCYDNIFAERLIGILKSEYCLDTRFMNFAQVNLAVKEVIHLYNTDRPHLSLNLAVPQGCLLR